MSFMLKSGGNQTEKLIVFRNLDWWLILVWIVTSSFGNMAGTEGISSNEFPPTEEVSPGLCSNDSQAENNNSKL